MTRYDPTSLPSVFIAELPKIIPKDKHTKLWEELDISCDVLKANEANEPIATAQNLLKEFMKKEKFRSLDKLLSALQNIASRDVSAKVKKFIEVTIAESIPRKTAEKLWERLGIDEDIVETYIDLPLSKQNIGLIKTWRIDPTHSIETLMVTIMEISSSDVEDEEEYDMTIEDVQSLGRQMKSTKTLPKSKFGSIPLCYADNYVWNEDDGTLTQRKEVSRKKFILNKDAISLLDSIDYPVCLVSIVGDSCTGKSYIMNQLHENIEKRGIFNVSSLQGYTKGLWMSGEPFLTTLPDGTESAVILIDSEGLDSLEDSQSEILFTMTVLISSVLIYNFKNITKPESSAKLRYFGKLASSIQIHKKQMKDKADSSDFYRLFPDLFWLLRDIASPLAIETKGHTTEVEARDYILLEILNTNEYSVAEEKGKQQSKLKKDIMDFFPVFDAMKLPIPSSCAEVRGKLNDMGSVENTKGVNQEFALGIQTFRSKMKRMMKPKKAWPQVGDMHGSHLAKFLEYYISTINGGTRPCIVSLWEDVIESFLEASVNKAKVVYKKVFGSHFAKNVPCDEIDILKQHDGAFCKALDLYNEETQRINDASLRIKHFRKLQDIIVVFDKDTVTITRGKLSTAIAKNEEASDRLCQFVAKEVIEKMTRPSHPEDEIFKSFEDIRKTIVNTIRDYNSRARGPKKLTVLQECLKKKIEIFFFDEKLLKNLADMLYSDEEPREKEDKEGYLKKMKLYVNWGEERQNKVRKRIEDIMQEVALTIKKLHDEAKKGEEILHDERVRLMRYAADRENNAWDIYFKQQKQHQTIDNEQMHIKQKQGMANRKKIYEHNAALLEEERKESESEMTSLIENKRRAQKRDVSQYPAFRVAGSSGQSQLTTVSAAATPMQLSSGPSAVGADQMNPMMAMMQMMMMKDQMVFKQMQERESATVDAVYKVMHHKDEERGKSETRFLDKISDSEQRGYDAVRREAEMRKEEHLKHSDTLLQMQRESEERESAIRDQHKLELKEREKREDEERRRREQDALKQKEREELLAKAIKEREIKIEKEKAARERKEQELRYQKSKWFNFFDD